MFASLRVTTLSLADELYLYYASPPLGYHISDCLFRDPPSSEVAATRSSLETRRDYLTTPIERNRFNLIRNSFNSLEDHEN